jgi:hypothetical protein
MDIRKDNIVRPRANIVKAGAAYLGSLGASKGGMARMAKHYPNSPNSAAYREKIKAFYPATDPNTVKGARYAMFKALGVPGMDRIADPRVRGIETNPHAIKPRYISNQQYRMVYGS